MEGINLIKKAIISVRIPLKTVPTNEKLKFDRDNNYLQKKYSKFKKKSILEKN